VDLSFRQDPTSSCWQSLRCASTAFIMHETSLHPFLSWCGRCDLQVSADRLLRAIFSHICCQVFCFFGCSKEAQMPVLTTSAPISSSSLDSGSPRFFGSGWCPCQSRSLTLPGLHRHAASPASELALMLSVSFFGRLGGSLRAWLTPRR
jgi:hypothetical protein